jgi:outer membrane murein-binding lipoprotein Lpp
MKPFVLPAITAVVLGGVVVATSLFGRRPASKDAVPNVPTSARALEDEVARLRREVSAVKAKTEASERLASSSAAPEGPPPATKRPLTREERREQSRAARDAWYSLVDSQFYGERPDPEWSTDAVRNARTMIASHAKNGTLVSAECATTMCKIVVTHADAEMQKEFSSEITEEPLLDAEVMYKYDADAQPPTTTMWLSRAGHRLPRVARR